MIIPNRCKCGATVDNGVILREGVLSSGSPDVIEPLRHYRMECLCCRRATRWCFGSEEAVVEWNANTSDGGGAS